MTTEPIVAQTHFIATPTAVACDLAGETVILDMASGQYFALDPIGTEIWHALQTPSSLASLCERLLREYDVARERCEIEVAALLQQLLDQGLVKAHAAAVE